MDERFLNPPPTADQDDTNQPLDAIFGDRVRRFQEFLDRIDSNTGIDYRSIIKDMLIKNKFRLSVSIDEIREFDREFWLGLLNQPADYLPACERALRDTVLAIYDPQDPSFPHDSYDPNQQYYLSFKGAFGDIRSLLDRLIPAIFPKWFLLKVL